MRTMILTGLLVGGLAGQAHSSFTITNGNAVFSSTQTPFLQDTTLSSADFRPDGTTDHVFYYNWSYRAPSGGNRGFSWIDTPVQVVAGDTLALTYTNAGPNPVGLNRFDATIRIKITDSTSPNAARLEAFVTFTAAATNSGPTSWELFNGVDVDLSATALNDVCTVSNPLGVVGTVSDPVTADTLTFFGAGANRFEAGSGSTLRPKLTGGAANNLVNTTTYTGDGAIGFQWTITNLAPGASVQLYSSFGLNAPPIPCPPDLNFDGVVNTADLAILLGNFGQTVPAFTLGDLNGDGVVNTLDLLIILAAFGSPC